MATTTYRVEGMTCDHCVHAVTTELLLVPGVEAVRVDLQGGTVSVTSAAPLVEDDVIEAVDEAGYTLITGSAETS